MISNRKIEQGPPDPTVKSLLSNHREALLIFVDPSKEQSRTANISVFHKFLDRDGTLVPYLAEILKDLLKTINARRGDPKSKAPTDKTASTN